MAFVGSINADLRALIAELAPSWRGRPCYVACSGNFTVERLLHQAGLTEIHGSDVSLYSCVLGSTLAGTPIAVGLREDAPCPWLAPYLEPGLPTVATLLLAMEYFKSAGRPEPYHRRIAEAYERHWPTLHARSLEKVTRLLDGVHLASFSPQDCVPFVEAVPEHAVVVGFPPTYASGYERLYQHLDETFAWQAPAYETFTPERFTRLCEVMQTKAAWLTMRDEPVDALAAACIGRFQTSGRAKPVFAYAGGGPIRTTSVTQKTEVVPWRRLAGPVVGPLRLVRLTAGQLNTLRSEYLAPGIAPAAAQVQLGIVTSTDDLIGALAFNSPQMLNGDHDVYMMSDFAVAPTQYPRLSKLVTAVALTKEVQTVLEQFLNTRVRRLGTHAFTTRPVSMKYRGLLTLRKRRKADGDKPAALYYTGDTGRWSLDGALAWWLTTHGTWGPASSEAA